jgi:hypothetical protein
MTRVVLMLMCALAVAGCSGNDVREMAENVRIRAEGAGARAESRRMDVRASMSGVEDGYRGVQLPDPPKPPPEKKVEPEKKPPPPIYVVVPAS